MLITEYLRQWNGCFSSPSADVVGNILDNFSLPLQLLGHVLQILFVVSVGVVQKLVTGRQKELHCIVHMVQH